MEAHEYTTIGALLIAFLSVAGTIFVAERSISKNAKRVREDRLVSGVERILEAGEESKQQVYDCIAQMTLMLTIQTDKIDTSNIRLGKISEFMALQKLYAPFANSEAESLPDSLGKWSEKFSDTLIKFASYPSDQDQLLKSFLQASGELIEHISRIEISVIEGAKKRNVFLT